MQPKDAKTIRQAVEAAREFAHASTLSGCDASDIDEIVESLEHELERPLPSVQTLATYMNSLVRSLRPQHHGGQIVAQLHEAMSGAGVHIEP